MRKSNFLSIWALATVSVLLMLQHGRIAASAQSLQVSAHPKAWWQYATIYQIYPRSFADSNGDGIGDLRGITARLDHLREIGVNAIWMSPMFESPQKDFGYDVSDFYAVHHEYGTMSDFEQFVGEATKRNIRVLLDFVPNHSSDEHEWFKKSKAGDAEYRDYYVWSNGKFDELGRRMPPNNWVIISMKYEHFNAKHIMAAN